MRDDPAAVEAHEHQAWQTTAPIYVDHVALLTATSGQIDLIRDAVPIADGARVLDVGCGPGVLSKQLAELGAEVVGIDFSANMIAEAKRYAPAVSFHEANVEHLPLPKDHFDVAVCNFTAHHFARPEQAFAEVHSVLKPGGALVVIHPIQSRQASWSSFAEACADVLPPEQVPGGALLNVEEPQDYIDLLTKAGFRDCTSKVRVKPCVMASVDTLINAAWKIAGLDSQPNDVQQRIRAGTVKRAQRHRKADGSYHFPDEVLLSTARK